MIQKPAYFVTGTDTGVGKTLVASTLAHTLSTRMSRVAVMKPVASGAFDTANIWENEDRQALMAVSNFKVSPDLVTPYLLKMPVSPHIAAQKEGVHIQLEPIQAAFQQLYDQADALVVEGLGGFCVPLSDTLDTAMMAADMGLPVILVVGMRLGCLNHALLTYEAIKARHLHVAGWVANLIDPYMRCIPENIAALEKRFSAPLLGSIPHMSIPTLEAAKEYLDFSSLPLWSEQR